MLIAQITDVHIGFAPDDDELNLQRLRAVVRRLIEGPNRPDLLLMSGDLTEHGDLHSYRRLAEVVAPCPFPVWAMTGNHDDRAALIEAFPQTTSEGGFVHYALELGAVRLLVLDTLEPGRHGGAFCEARAAWLTCQLDAEPDRPTLIAMHHPPFESCLIWLDSDAREPWIARFAATIARRPQVKAIVAGHLHRTIHTQWNGVPVTVSGSTAPAVGLDLSPLDPRAPDGRVMIVAELPVYALHRWDGERLVSHFESVGALEPLARYDERLQPVVQHIQSERPKG